MSSLKVHRIGKEESGCVALFVELADGDKVIPPDRCKISPAI
jgi:hypothetical protein